MVVPPKPNQIFYAYPLPPSSPFLQSNILQVVYLLIHVFIGYEFSSVEYALVEKPFVVPVRNPPLVPVSNPGLKIAIFSPG
jgi:hypothetical protein